MLADFAWLDCYLHDFPAAQRMVAGAVRAAPHDARVLAVQMRVLDWSTKLGDATAAEKAALALAAKDPLVQVFASEVLADTGDLQGAETQLDSAQPVLGSDPWLQAEWHRERGNLAGDRGDHATQLQEMLTARTLQPHWVYRATEVVEAQLQVKDRDGARQTLHSVLPDVPDDVTTLETLVSEAISDSDFGDAAVLSTRAVALAPNSAAVRDLDGEVRVAGSGDISGAQADFYAAVHAGADVHAAAYLLALGRYVQSDGQDALHLLNLAQQGARVRVDPDADQSEAQQRALGAINTYRAAAGLAPVALDDHLNTSALTHAWYWVFNNASPSVLDLGIHLESPGLLGYRGVYPWNRATAAGYPDQRIGEDITHRGDPAGAVDDWVNSVYHRFPVMRRDLTAIGFGAVALGPLLIEDMEFGFAPSASGDPVLYPADGGKGVPVIFVDNELPDPLPAGVPRSVGYPVTATFAAGQRVALRSFSLSGPGGAVDAYVLPVAGDTENSVTLLPKQPLAPASTYQAQCTAVVDGQTRTIEWSFTTVS